MRVTIVLPVLDVRNRQCLRILQEAAKIERPDGVELGLSLLVKNEKLTEGDLSRAELRYEGRDEDRLGRTTFLKTLRALLIKHGKRVEVHILRDRLSHI